MSIFTAFLSKMAVTNDEYSSIFLQVPSKDSLSARVILVSLQGFMDHVRRQVIQAGHLHTVLFRKPLREWIAKVTRRSCELVRTLPIMADLHKGTGTAL